MRCERLRLGGHEGESLRSASDMLERQVRQMSRLVDDLLDMSRITRGRIELRKEPLELAPVVSHAVEAARALYRSMDHELTVTMPDAPMQLSADPTRLAQVIGNLLNNASKFTDKGGHVWLTVEKDGTRRSSACATTASASRRSTSRASGRCSRKSIRRSSAHAVDWVSASHS